MIEMSVVLPDPLSPTERSARPIDGGFDPVQARTLVSRSRNPDEPLPKWLDRPHRNPSAVPPITSDRDEAVPTPSENGDSDQQAPARGT